MEKEVIIKQLRDALGIQLSDGNWNYNSYNHGLANGLIFALSIVEGTDPKYIDRPEEWIEDIREAEKAKAAKELEKKTHKKDKNHSHYWVASGVLYETYTTIRGVRYRSIKEVAGKPDSANTDENGNEITK